MTRKLLLFVFFIFSGSSAVCVTAADVVSEGAGGGVNWTQGYIWADGYGVARDGVPERQQRLLARRAAQVDAYRNLAEFVDGVRVNSNTLVKQMVLDSDVVRTKVDALVKGARMVKDHYQNDVAQVTLRIYMDGDFSSTVNLSKAARNQMSFWPLPVDPLLRVKGLAGLLLGFVISSAHASSNQAALIRSSSDLELANRLIDRGSQVDAQQLLKQLERDTRNYESSSDYTGLLIDASAIPEFELATIPRIRDPAGKIIYPREELLSGALAAKRPVSYDFDVDDAIRNARIAVTPYVIRAQGVFRSRVSDLVISESDAHFIRDNDQFSAIVSRAGVMIVVAE